MSLVEGWMVGCGLANKDGIYDIKELAKDIKYPWRVKIGNSSKAIEFNLCEHVTPCHSTADYVWAKIVNDQSCLESLTTEGDPTFSLIKVNDSGYKDLVVNFSGIGANCENGTYQFVVVVKCNSNYTTETAKPKLIVSEGCHYEVLLEVSEGCPLVNLSVFWTFVKLHYPLFAIGFMLLGGLIGIFGKSMWNIILFVLFSMTVTMLILILIYELVLPVDSPIWLLWILLIVSIAVGLALGYILTKYQDAGFILLGAWLGATFTIIFENIILRAIVLTLLVYKMWKTALIKGIILGAGLLLIPLVYKYFPNEYTFWACMIATVVLCGAASYSMQELLVTIATAFIGAYIAVRGLSLLIGGFPDEMEVYTQIKNGKIEYSVNMAIYGGVILVVTVIFVFVQEYLARDEEEKSDMEEEMIEKEHRQCSY